MKPIKPIIFGCKGLELTSEEKSFFENSNPFGFILFARNVETPEQLKKLTMSLRETIGRDDAPILIDQEGGKVRRLKPPYWRDMAAGEVFGSLAKAKGIEMAKKAAFANFSLSSMELKQVGIDVNCAPILDTATKEMTQAIGSRAYSDDFEIISEIGESVCQAMLSQGVMPVMKHIPGHGRATVDSHMELPVVSASFDELSNTDFVPFSDLRFCPWAMTAHIVYEDIDANNPATLSKTMIQDIIRDYIGFDGLLLSDDFSMKALKGSFEEKTSKCIEAGCDVVLHCNGDMNEMLEINGSAKAMSEKSLERAKIGFEMRKQAVIESENSFSKQKLEDELAECLKQ
jgi:beta-N-acetylhexosaminidase